MTMETVQIEREGEIRYSRPVERALLRDRRISWGAKGIFSFLWDCPKNWSPKVEHLAQMGPDGRDATRSRLRELESVGAMQRKPLFGPDGKLLGSRWILRAPSLWAQESSLGTAEKRISRPSAKPDCGERTDVGNPVAKVNQLQESTKYKEEEHYLIDAVDKLRSIGVVIQNIEDVENGRRLVSNVGGRFDLIRNAVAIVRSRREKNRPFISTVTSAALGLLEDERWRDQRDKNTEKLQREAASNQRNIL